MAVTSMSNTLTNRRIPKPGHYSVGELRDPRPEDERFDEQVNAEKAARSASYPGRILGVWRDEDGELVAIAYDGMVYWP